MRALFGLVGVLMVVAIIILWLNGPGGISQTETVLKTGQKAESQIAQIGGRDTESHMPAGSSAKLEPQVFGGRLDSILVASVVPGGAYDRYFGLKANDAIIAIETHGAEQRVKELGDGEMAVLQVIEAYSKQGHLLVMREGEEIRLPKAPAPGAQPSGGKSGSDDPLQKQLDVLQGIPGAR